MVTRLLGLPQEINSRDPGLTHLQRWTIFEGKRFHVYLDHSYGDDWVGDCYRYPERFISIGLVESRNEDGFEGFPDRDAWMVLIGQSSKAIELEHDSKSQPLPARVAT